MAIEPIKEINETNVLLQFNFKLILKPMPEEKVKQIYQHLLISLDENNEFYIQVEEIKDKILSFSLNDTKII